MGKTKWSEYQSDYAKNFFKSLNGRYKRIRKRCKQKPDPELYGLKVEQLAQLEQLQQKGLIDLFYGDESHICSHGYVPYGWQFADEKVYIPVEKAFKVNLWGLVNRDNQLHWATTEENINAHFVAQQLDRLSFQLIKPTVVVLDNAKIHTCKAIKNQKSDWLNRGLYLFYLPPYSPELNIAETLWRKIKKEQIDPKDYANKDSLFYATNRCLAQLGVGWKIKFSRFKHVNIN